MPKPKPLSVAERIELGRIIKRGETVTVLDMIRYEVTVRDMETFVEKAESDYTRLDRATKEILRRETALVAERKRLWDALHKISHEEPAYEQGRECRGCQAIIDIAREATREQ